MSVCFAKADMQYNRKKSLRFSKARKPAYKPYAGPQSRVNSLDDRQITHLICARLKT